MGIMTRLNLLISFFPFYLPETIFQICSTLEQYKFVLQVSTGNRVTYCEQTWIHYKIGRAIAVSLLLFLLLVINHRIRDNERRLTMNEQILENAHKNKFRTLFQDTQCVGRLGVGGGCGCGRGRNATILRLQEITVGYMLKLQHFNRTLLVDQATLMLPV